MHFAITEPAPWRFNWGDVVALGIFAGIFAWVVGMPVLLWLRRSSREAPDVLLSASALPPGGFGGSLRYLGWLAFAAILLCLHVWGLALAHSALFSLESVLWNFPKSGWSEAGAPSVGLGWILAVEGVVGFCLVRWWQRASSASSTRDVLRVSPHA